ncbi:hypothetical protein ABJZ22_18140, partial [Vibrio parahaemolyticus]|uniref:hypothetical protein n=1 Tax=Vibrio parahaemolyticus TaxID=670 RepID=UPI0032AFE719
LYVDLTSNIKIEPVRKEQLSVALFLFINQIVKLRLYLRSLSQRNGESDKNKTISDIVKMGIGVQ